MLPLLPIKHGYPTIPDKHSCGSSQRMMVVRNLAKAPHIDLQSNLESYKNNMLKSKIEDKETFLKILTPALLNQTPILALLYDLHAGRLQYVMGPKDLFSSPHAFTELCAIQTPDAKNIMQIRSFGVLHER